MMLNQISPYIDFSYFLAIFLLSLSIYFQTRKMQIFSLHRGIRYFRNAFLYFSMVYLFRFLVLNLQFLIIPPDLEPELSQSGTFLVIFFSFLSVFTLLSSFLWKRYRFISDNRLALLSLFIACVTFFIRLPLTLLILGVVAALFLVLKAYDSYSKKRQVISPLFFFYTLLLAFVLFDLVPITQQTMPFEFRIAGYIGSICVFVYINLKIRKVLTTGEDEEK